jgi:hypothetical protein
MNFSIPAAAPYIIPVMSWVFAGVPIVLGLLALGWILKNVRIKC